MAKKKKELDVLVKVDFSQLNDLKKSLSELAKTIDSISNKAKNLDKSFRKAFTSIINIQKSVTKDVENLVKKRISLYKKESSVIKNIFGKSSTFSISKSKISFPDKSNLLEDYKLKAIDLSTKIKLTPKNVSIDVIDRLNQRFQDLKNTLNDLENKGVINRVFKTKEISKFTVSLSKLYTKIRDYGRKVDEVNKKSIIKERQNKLIEDLKVRIIQVNQKLSNMSFRLRDVSGKELKEVTKEVTKLKKELMDLASKNLIKKTFATQQIARFDTKLNNITKAVKINNNALRSWWERFGEVTLGFTLMYRAMNYVEDGIRNFIDFSKNIITQMDETTNAIYKTAMMYQFFGNSTISFADSIKKATNIVYSMKLAMINTTASIEDVTAGLDELAQHGVFITDTSKLKAYALLFGLIGDIATTTGSSMKQVRQEIQALFEGAKRPGNIFLKFVSSLERTGKVAEGTTNKLKNAATAEEAFGVILKQVVPVVSKMNEKMLEMSSSAAKTRFVSILSLIGEIGLRMTNFVKTGDQAKNVFAQIYNNASKSLVNLDKLNTYFAILEKLNSLTKKRDQYIKLGLDVSDIDKQIKDTRNKLKIAFSGVFTKEGKNLAKSMHVIFSTISDIFKSIVNSIVDVINTVSKVVLLIKAIYINLKPAVDLTASMFIKFVGILAILKALSIAQSVLVSGITTMVSAVIRVYNSFKSIVGVMASLAGVSNATMLAVIGIVTAITAVLASLYVLYKVWKKQPEVVRTAVKLIGLYFGKLANKISYITLSITSFIIQLFSVKLPAVMVTSVEVLVDLFKNAFYRIELKVLKSFNFITSKLKTFIKPLAAFFGKMFGVSEDNIEKSLNNILTVSDKKLSELKDKIKKTTLNFGNLSDKYNKNVSILFKNNVVLQYMEKMKGVFKENILFYNKEIDNAKYSFSDFFKVVGSTAKSEVKKLLDSIPIINNVIKSYKDLQSNLDEVLKNLAGGEGFGSNGKSGIKTTIELIDKLTTSLDNLINSAKQLYNQMSTYNFSKLFVFTENNGLAAAFDVSDLKDEVNKYYSQLKDIIATKINTVSDELEKRKLRIKLGLIEIDALKFKFDTDDFVKKFRKSISDIKNDWESLKKLMSNKSISGEDLIVKYNAIKEKLKELIDVAKSGEKVDFSHFGVKDLENAQKLYDSIVNYSYKIGKYVFDTSEYVKSFRKNIELYKNSLNELKNKFNSNEIFGSDYIDRLTAMRKSMQEMLNDALNNKEVDFSVYGVKDIKELKDALSGVDKELEKIKNKKDITKNLIDSFMKFTDSVNNSIEIAKDAAAASTKFVDSLISNTANVFKKFIIGESITLKGFLSGIASDMLDVITRLIAKMLVLKTLEVAGISITGAANGGVFEGGIKFFANGGVVDKPTIGIVGEGKYNEAIVPLPDGRHIPAIVKDNNKNQQKQNTEVNIVNVVDPNMMLEVLASSAGQNVIVNAIANNNYKIKKILSS